MDKQRQGQIELAASKCWHDLRKDPQDLPNNSGNVIVCTEFCGGVVYGIEYYSDNWMCNSGRMRKRVLAWMEFPEFKD